MRWLAKLIYFKVFGWKIMGNTNFSQDTIKKAVIIGAPHTSNLDFIVGLFLRKITRTKTNFIGKKELFIWPFGFYFRAVGGIPIDRVSGQDKVETIAKLFNDKKEFRLALSPEGTRKKVDKWKTGFYYIAKAANVPIIMFTFDYKNKLNTISEPFYPTNNIEADFNQIHHFYKGILGKTSEFS